jgi:hypothetical protein
MTYSVVSAAMFCLLAYVVPNDTGKPPRSAPCHMFYMGTAGELADVVQRNDSDASSRALLPTSRNLDFESDDDDADTLTVEIDDSPTFPDCDPDGDDAQPRGTPPCTPPRTPP